MSCSYLLMWHGEQSCSVHSLSSKVGRRVGPPAVNVQRHRRTYAGSQPRSRDRRWRTLAAPDPAAVPAVQNLTSPDRRGARTVEPPLLPGAHILARASCPARAHAETDPAGSLPPGPPKVQVGRANPDTVEEMKRAVAQVACRPRPATCRPAPEPA